MRKNTKLTKSKKKNTILNWSKKKKIVIGTILMVLILLITCWSIYRIYFQDEYLVHGSNLSENVILGQYKNVEIQAVDENITISQDEVDNRIKEMLQDKAKHVEVIDRSVRNGDTVIIDFDGTLDGKSVEGASSTGFYLTIGNKSFVDGFEDNLIGKSVGETVYFKLQYPEKYENNPKIAGKILDYTVKINGIIENQIPKLNNEFVREYECKTVEDFKRKMKEEIKEEKQEELLEERKNQVWDTIVSNCTITDYPVQELEESIEDVHKYYNEAAGAYGVDEVTFREKYLNDISEEEIKNTAQEILGEKMIVHAIAQEEKITITDRELKKGAKELAEKYNYISGEAFIEGNGGDVIKESMLVEKIKQFVFPVW